MNMLQKKKEKLNSIESLCSCASQLVLFNEKYMRVSACYLKFLQPYHRMRKEKKKNMVFEKHSSSCALAYASGHPLF